MDYVSKYSTQDQWSYKEGLRPKYWYFHAGARLHVSYEEHESLGFALGLEREKAQDAEDALFLQTFEGAVALSRYTAELLVRKLQAMYPPEKLAPCATDAVSGCGLGRSAERSARARVSVPTSWALYWKNGHRAANRAIREHRRGLLAQGLSKAEVGSAMETKLCEFENLGTTDTAVREVLYRFLGDYFDGGS